MTASKKAREFESNSTTHQTSIRGNPTQLKLIYCNTREWSYPNIGTKKKKNLTPSSVKLAVNCNMEMKCQTVRRSRATTSCQLQTNHHPQATTTGVQNVVTQHIGKGSHAQWKSISARYVTNLGTLLVNVSKRNNIINRTKDSLRHIRYK